VRPTILVPGRVVPAGRYGRDEVVAVGRRYLDAVARAGATALVCGPGTPSDVVERVDGLLLTGGGDVDPARYGAVPDARTYGVDPGRDDLEFGLLAAALDAALPVLAVCRGLQVLNVARGGTLLQHVDTDLARRPASFPAPEPGTIGPLVEVVLEPTCRLAAAIGTAVLHGSHSHHQAVDRLGGGLRQVGRAADGVVEAVELDGDAWVVAVQWHPEDTATVDPAQQAIFDRFVVESTRRSP